MPFTQTTPTTVQATQWLVHNIHVLDMEAGGGGVKLRVELGLYTADGLTKLADATFIVADNAQFNTDFTNATGSTLVKMRKAAYAAGVAQGVLPAGTGT